MKIQLVQDFSKDYDAYIMPIWEGKVSIYEGLSAEQRLLIETLMKQNEFTGKVGTSVCADFMHKGKLVKAVYVGLGKMLKASTYVIIDSLHKALKGIKGSVLIGSEGLDLNHIAEAIYYASYDFNQYKTDKKTKKAQKTKEKASFDIFVAQVDEDGEPYTENGEIDPMDIQAFTKGTVLAESVLLTRDLVNEPANVIYPETLAARAVALGKSYGFEVEVFEEPAIKKLKMDAFLSVARAAEKRPRFIVMRYMGDPKNKKEIHGLVGKGLTYDSGGLSLKPANSMTTMKTDMGGAATVIGTISALARNKVQKNVVAVVAACENSIGGNAYRPGDIIGSMSGKTIEIGNTDAEGRLTLADAVHYIITKEHATDVIDVATLTGAVTVALGNTTTGVLTNTPDMYTKLTDASVQAGERVWMLPNFTEYKELFKSKIADIKNVGGRGAGTITAGMFIEAFVDKTPWMHLDIAGTVDTDKPYGYYTLGGTGQMVRTLYYYYEGLTK